MKKNLVALSFVVVFGMMAGFAFAGANMRVDIPFDFYMGNQLFPAGEYHFDMNRDNHAIGSLVTVWAPKGSDGRLLMTTAGTDINASVNQLVFNKYGRTLFLSAVSINGHRANLRALTLEREMRSQAEQAPSVITVAQK
jgi:hypothetical protein